jgi:hypothetical protein
MIAPKSSAGEVARFLKSMPLTTHAEKQVNSVIHHER